MPEPRKRTQGISELTELEQSIHAAGNYVIPNRDLRPKVLSEAKDAHAKKRSMHGLLACFLLMVAIWGLTMPIRSLIYQAHEAAANSVNPIQQRAQEMAGDSRSRNWALVEAYWQSRNQHRGSFFR